MFRQRISLPRWLRLGYWFPPLPPTKSARFYLVRRGEDLTPSGGPLTERGREQAVEAARRIQWRAAGSPTIVVLPEVSRAQASYVDTAQIIATVLKAPTTQMWYGSVLSVLSRSLSAVDEPYRDALFDLQRMQWRALSSRERRTSGFPELRVITVADGSLLNRLLSTFGAPPGVTGNELGPELGTVLELVLEYNRKTGQIIRSEFVPEPAEVPAT